MFYIKDVMAKLHRVVKDVEVLTPTAQTTTASFVDVTDATIDALYYDSVAFAIGNTGGANGLSWKVLASIDGVVWVEVQSSANVAFGANDKYTVAPAPYRYYKPQVKDQSGGSHTTALVSVIGK